MIIKFLEKEDFINYKKCSMVIGFPYCTFKCDKESGCQICQNFPLFKQANRDISIEKIFEVYQSSELTEAIVCGGLEPLDSIEDLLGLIAYFRSKGYNDTFVVYTGYTEEEVLKNSEWSKILNYSNIIIKYGRFRPNCDHHLDSVLGIELASPNQYAKEYI